LTECTVLVICRLVIEVKNINIHESENESEAINLPITLKSACYFFTGQANYRMMDDSV